MDLKAEIKLEQQLITSISNGDIGETKLETDDKVLARVTDGIYRQPGSALRELISNAYDADADNVYVETDAPRFDTMTIRDDGNGMSISTLVNMLRHIGGSAKRTDKGKDLKVTDDTDNSLSLNKKRKLIGKIGIGLFSVAQLTRDFEIVTKQAGSDFYLKAKVQLFNFSDEGVKSSDNENSERGKSFQTGNVKIWKESTNNIDAHGTDILLFNIKQSAKEQLKSGDVWGQTENESDVENISEENDFLDSSKAILPDFHIGYLTNNKGIQEYNSDFARLPSLPWSPEDKPEDKFLKLYDAILDKTKNAVSPKLNFILDNYLQMIWTLGLSIPLDYIEKHPFSLNTGDLSDVYTLSNKKKGQAEKLPESLEPFGETLGFSSQKIQHNFNVCVDGIKLFRPLKYTNLPQSKALIKKPILFLGKYHPNLSGVDIRDSGGELSFEAYFLWAPKVSPKDHNGSLIRIHDASGILFDETFMKYQVAEYTIKSQLTAEIFVTKGLDSALNIDRESFNTGHPHYQIVMRWVHSAIRQIVNRYKIIRKEARNQSITEESDNFSQKISEIVSSSIKSNFRDPLELAKLVVRDESVDNTTEQDSTHAENYIISKKNFDEIIPTRTQQTPKNLKLIKKSEAILQVLDGYGVLDNMTVNSQEELLLDIVRILSLED
ncbi:ATP-binding protein [Pseudoalteromonas sp. SWYJZ19]|uniref:ATP-binding protein n=1 Tax=Pseudoalteromonas sp. SWYJZ19 TaxID=2792068 RepID=UPI0018CCB2C5|nr:ATP-binding protein [Pseudoalteromonas sp. SWYJZ19]MBH0051671.1 ATP-binding protein [Pseudoalteromonas sp. SWYJZ19]